MIKADDKVKFEDIDEDKTKEELYTNFELLYKKVEKLIETIDEHAEILKDNDIYRTKKIHAPYCDMDDVYTELMEEAEDEKEV